MINYEYNHKIAVEIFETALFPNKIDPKDVSIDQCYNIEEEVTIRYNFRESLYIIYYGREQDRIDAQFIWNMDPNHAQHQYINNIIRVVKLFRDMKKQYI